MSPSLHTKAQKVKTNHLIEMKNSIKNKGNQQFYLKSLILRVKAKLLA